MNLAFSTYWSPGANLFINQVYGGNSEWEGDGVEMGSDGWAGRLGAGKSCRIGVFLSSAVPMRTGRYVATCQAPCTIEVQLSGIEPGTSKQVSPQRVEFDLASTPRGEWSVTLVMTNASAATLASIGEVALLKSSDEAAFRSGRWVTDEAIADLRDTDVLRFMDYCGVNDGPHTDVASIPAGVLAAVKRRRCLPPETIMRIAKEADRVPWICVPWQFDAKQIGLLAARYKAAADLVGYTGAVGVEFGNEAWNWAFSMRNGIAHIAADEGLTLRDNRGAITRDRGYASQAAYGHRSLQCWAAFEAHFTRAKVWRCTNQQTWYGGYGAALHYVDPATGLRLGDLADFAGIAPYFNLDHAPAKRLTAAGLPASVSQRDCLLNKYHLKPDSFFDSAWRVAIDDVIDSVVAFRKDLIANGFDGLPLCMYEGGDHEFFQIDEISQAQADAKACSDIFLCTVDAASNVLDIAAPTSSYRKFDAGFDNGDRIAWCYLGASSKPISATKYGESTHWSPTVYVKTVAGGAQLELYEDADFSKRIALTPSPGTVYGVFSATRVAALTKRLDGLMDSPFGAALYQHYWRSLRAVGVRWIAQYFDVSGYVLGGDAQRFNGSWGLKRSHYQPNDAPGADRYAAWVAFK